MSKVNSCYQQYLKEMYKCNSSDYGTNYKNMDLDYIKCIRNAQKNHEKCNFLWAIKPWSDYVNKK